MRSLLARGSSWMHQIHKRDCQPFWGETRLRLAIDIVIRLVEQAMEGFELRFGLENDANGSSLLDFNVPVPINLNQWHHYAATYASTSGLMKVYLDGMFVSEWNVGPIAVNQILTPTLIGFFRPNGDHSLVEQLTTWGCGIAPC